jgi:hypothetical protein
VIAEPYNDGDCLGKLTEHARERVTAPEVQGIARQFPTIAELAAMIRTLPQTDDTGDPLDGPKLACDVPQRVRVPARDPNCFERACFFLAAAENIEPGGVYALATIDTEHGRHTFPVANGEPVVLDPILPRNAMAAGLDAIVRAGARGRPFALTFSEALGWALSIAAEPVGAYGDGAQVLEDAHSTAAAVVDEAPIDREGLAALLWVLAVAEREQARWWPSWTGVVRRLVELLAERAPPLVVDAPSCGCGPEDDDATGPARNGWRIEWAPRRFARAVEGSAEQAARAVRPLVKPAIKLALSAYGVPPALADVGDRAPGAARSNRARAVADTRTTDGSEDP